MYRKITPTVEAFEVTTNQAAWPSWARSAWAGGTIRPYPGPIGEAGVLHVSGADVRMRAGLGDWIVNGDDGMLLVVPAADFSGQYEVVG